MNSKTKASRKYDKENTISKLLKFNKKTDTDIIQHIETINQSFQGYVKELIRKDIGR